MSRVWPIAALVRADVLERTRRYQYLATIVATMLLGTLLLPGRNANYETFLIDGYRGVYNSAWVGASYALLSTLLLSLFGFYLVKSAVERDRATRVGEIIATTSIDRLSYTLGKVLSNFLILASVTAILFVTAIAMQLVRGENTSVNLAQIAAPFALVVLPTVAIVGAIAVFFEIVPWLRAGLGNVVYFFLWSFYAAWSFQAKLHAGWLRDMFGANLIMRQVWSAVLRVDPRASPNSFEIGAEAGANVRHSFTLSGFHWTAGDVSDRLIWFGVAFGVAVVSALLFDRFSKSARSAERRPRSVLATRWSAAVERVTTPVFDVIFAGDLGAIVLAELRLLVRGLSPWWYAVALGLWLFQLGADAKAQSIAVGLAWIWPMLLWSQLGTREHVYGTEEFVYPTLRPIRRQFAAQWLAGVILALALAGGALVHWGVRGDLVAIEGIVAGAIFVPTLALACGAFSGTTRLFEIIYLVLWYIGPMNRTMFDFTRGVNAPGFLLASIVLLVLAVAMRKLRLQYA